MKKLFLLKNWIISTSYYYRVIRGLFYDISEKNMFHFKKILATNIDNIIDLWDIYIFHGELEKIIEITYSYREISNKYILNETLFEEYTWKTYPDYSIDQLKKSYIHKIKKQIKIIDHVISKTKKISTKNEIQSRRKWLFCESLEYVNNILKISLLWIDFEAQKAWMPLNMSPEEIRSHITKIETREKLAFWKKIIDDAQDFSLCYNFVKRNHDKKKVCEHVKGCKKMSSYLKTIKENSKQELIKTPDIQRKILRGSFLKRKISRPDYRKVFDKVCELYELPQRTKLSSAGSIYDWDHCLEIPRDKSHQYFRLDRLLRLLTHEIESHYINAYNGKILVWNFRGAKNLPKEEGLAMFMEKIFTGYTYENIDNIVEYYFTIMAWESLPWEDFENFMKIMWKEYRLKRNYKKSILRAKRNYPFEYTWVQHKDTVYFRGLMEIIQYLKSGWQFRKLFLWKVWFNDIEDLESIYLQHPRRDDVIYPFFISDLIYYRLSSKQKNKDFIFDVQAYYLYLKKKYWFIDLDDFNIINQIQSKQKKIDAIIKIIEKSIV